MLRAHVKKIADRKSNPPTHYGRTHAPMSIMIHDSLSGLSGERHSAKMSFYSGILYAKFFDCGVTLAHRPGNVPFYALRE
jgi:hypothetical protein